MDGGTQGLFNGTLASGFTEFPLEIFDERVYVNKLRPIPQLKNNIRVEIDFITPEILGKVMKGVLERKI